MGAPGQDAAVNSSWHGNNERCCAQGREGSEDAQNGWLSPLRRDSASSQYRPNSVTEVQQRLWSSITSRGAGNDALGMAVASITGSPADSMPSVLAGQYLFNLHLRNALQSRQAAWHADRNRAS